MAVRFPYLSRAFHGDGDLEVEKSLIWNTKIPFENKERHSSHFSLMDLQWRLRFSYSCLAQLTPSTSSTLYHVITLHQVTDGEVSSDSETAGRVLLEKGFSIKTFLMHAMALGCDEKRVMHENAVYPTARLWYAGFKKEDIFKCLPSLYDRCEVKVVCKFYGQPLYTFQLEIKENRLFRSRRTRNKSVQVSSEVPQDMESLSCDFSNLLEEGILPDVKLKCGRRTFQAHRSVLAARSEVFRAMFQNKMLESQTGDVKVSDMDAAVLEELLKFIYSGKLEELSEEDTADLYEAADKYNVGSLKTACSYWMIRNLSEENCINYLRVSNSHSDSDLKDAVISFIIRHSKILKSEAWSTFLKEPSDLVSEVFKAYVDSSED